MIRISKRADMPQSKRWIIRISAIILALAIMSFFFIFLGHNPLEVYQTIITGSLGTYNRFVKTIELVIPLSLSALGIMIAFKMKFWNIGAEGQIVVGAIAATFVALNFSELNSVLLLSMMFIASALAGGIYAFIPAIFKVKFKTNETLFTLMLNYIALRYVTYLQYGPWKDPAARGFPKIANFAQNARLPRVFQINAGWIILIVFVALIYVLMNKSKLGYEIAVIGESQKTAKYAGMNVAKVIVMALFISGALSGIVGMIQVAGVNYTLSDQVSGGMGFTAIIIAWLSQIKVLLIPVVGFFFAMLVQGATFIRTAFQIPQSIVDILQAIILFFALGSEFFINYKLHFERKAKGRIQNG
jgi:simple sugar transport system permease protein